MRTLDDMLSKQLQDEEFKKEYEDIQPEMDVIRAIAVSYTHLDVYKRQLYCIQSFGKWSDCESDYKYHSPDTDQSTYAQCKNCLLYTSRCV